MDYYFNVTTPPATTPITRDEAKSWMRDIPDADNLIVDICIAAAVDQGEKYTNRNFISRTYEGFFSCAEYSRYEIGLYIQVSRNPILSISSFEYMSNGSLVAVPSDNYELKQVSSGFPRIIFSELPNYDADVVYPFKLTFISGFGAAADVPAGIKMALLKHVAFLYENRGDVEPDGGQGMPIEVRADYSNYRITSVCR